MKSTTADINDNTPVLVGCAQYLDNKGIHGLNYLDILSTVSKSAIEDCESKIPLYKHLDTVSVIRFVADTPNRDSATTNLWGYSNMPRSLANSLNITASSEIYTTTGGNSPQLLLNELSNRIRDKQIECALLAGGESLDTFVSKLKAGETVDWGDDPGGEPESIGSTRDGATEFEQKHGIFDPPSVYPLFANGIRRNENKKLEEHLDDVSSLFSKFSKVASLNKYAWFKVFRTPEEIKEVKPENRMVGFPYTKYMNSMIRVNQSAAIIVTSVKKAKELGIPENKWIYMHAGACLNDIWNVTERVDYHSSPAIKECTSAILEKANCSTKDIEYFDIYSCFPSAVQIAMKEIGINPKDKRDLTVTGGLPYFGGPGNAYVLNSMASMIKKLRQNKGKFGMVTANGWYLTKHGAGIFSSTPCLGEWNQVVDSSNLQKKINEISHPEFIERADGKASIETYTIVNSREGPKRGIIIGRLDNGKRFLANTNKDKKLLTKMMEKEMLDTKGKVKFENGKNIFEPV